MQQEDKRKKKQKLLIVFPLFVILIAGLLIGLVNITKKKAPEPDPKATTKSAFNTNLPAPDLPTKEKNKLEVYMEAAKDSAQKKAEWERDPNNKRFYDPGPTTAGEKQPATKPVAAGSTSRVKLPVTESTDPNEKKVNDRLAKLYAALNQSTSKEKQEKTAFPDPATGHQQVDQANGEIARLEKLLQAARTPDTVADPNLTRVEKVLDKVLDIQHPERVKDRTKTAATWMKPTVYDVTTTLKDTTQTETEYKEGLQSGPNAFYGLEQDQDIDTATNATTIQAVVHETQTLQNGSTIKLRLLQDIFIGGHRIPACSFIYGQCTVSSERLNVQLTSAVCNDQIYPIALKVYDTDGLEGIYVPGAITRDVTKEGISQGISGMGITSLDPSLGAQAAAAGIETAKSLLSKKVKAVVVTVKAGHRILLGNPQATH
jgi:conjugative transposon TraM protein